MLQHFAIYNQLPFFLSLRCWTGFGQLSVVLLTSRWQDYYSLRQVVHSYPLVAFQSLFRSFRFPLLIPTTPYQQLIHGNFIVLYKSTLERKCQNCQFFLTLFPLFKTIAVCSLFCLHTLVAYNANNMALDRPPDKSAY